MQSGTDDETKEDSKSKESKASEENDEDKEELKKYMTIPKYDVQWRRAVETLKASKLFLEL